LAGDAPCNHEHKGNNCERGLESACGLLRLFRKRALRQRQPIFDDAEDPVSDNAGKAHPFSGPIDNSTLSHRVNGRRPHRASDNMCRASIARSKITF